MLFEWTSYGNKGVAPSVFKSASNKGEIWAERENLVKIFDLDHHLTPVIVDWSGDST